MTSMSDCLAGVNSFMAPQFRPMAPVVGGQWPRPPVTFFTLLRVGGKEFVGEGRTRQMAKHNAAAKALRVLRQTPDEPQPGACAASPPNNNGEFVLSALIS